MAGLSKSMMSLLTDFSTLSFAQDAARNAAGESTAPYTIRAGNDVITGGGGMDTVFGDSGLIVVPGTASVTGVAGSLSFAQCSCQSL